VPERLRCGTIPEEVSQILQRVSAGAARRISVLSCIGKMTREGCGRGSEVGIVHSVSPPQRGGAVPALSLERWAKMARQLSRGVRLSDHP